MDDDDFTRGYAQALKDAERVAWYRVRPELRARLRVYRAAGRLLGVPRRPRLSALRSDGLDA